MSKISDFEISVFLKCPFGNDFVVNNLDFFLIFLRDNGGFLSILKGLQMQYSRALCPKFIDLLFISVNFPVFF